MLRGGLGGLGSRGGTGAIDAPPVDPYGWNAYHRRDPGGALVLGTADADDATLTTATPLYPAGVRVFRDAAGAANPWGGVTLANLQGGGLADAIYAIPQPLPAGKVIRLVYAVVGNAPAAGSFQLGLYRALGGSGSTNLYPGDLVYDSGSIAAPGLGVKSAGAIAGGVTLPRQGLYYFTITADADAAPGGGTSGTAAIESHFYPVMGHTVRWGFGEPLYNSSLCIGWRAARVFGGALPSVFPAGARRLVIATGNTTIPVIFYGFDPTGQ